VEALCKSVLESSSSKEGVSALCCVLKLWLAKLGDRSLSRFKGRRVHGASESVAGPLYEQLIS
jgi:hypothetical protein